MAKKRKAATKKKAAAKTTKKKATKKKAAKKRQFRYLFLSDLYLGFAKLIPQAKTWGFFVSNHSHNAIPGLLFFSSSGHYNLVVLT